MTTRRESSSETDGAGAALAARLREARGRLGLSVREMAELTGIAPATLAALEGGREPRWSTLMRCLETVPGLRASELLPPPSPVPPMASRSVHAFMAEAFGFRARRVAVTLSLEADGRATREELFEGLRWIAAPGPRSRILPRLLQVCERESRAVLSRLIEPPLDQARLAFEENGVHWEYRIEGDGDAPEVSCRIVRPLEAAPAEVILELGVPADTIELSARFGDAAPGGARARVVPDARASEGDAADIAPFLYPRGVAVARDADGRGLRASFDLPMPALRYALHWAGEAPADVPPAPLPFTPSLGSITRRLREEAGFSTRELARRMGMSHASVLAAEQGRDARAGTLRAYLRALPDVPPQALLPADGPVSPSSIDGAWEWYREAYRLEAESFSEVMTVHSDGTREGERRLANLRSLDPAGRAVQVLLALGKGPFLSARSTLESIATEAGENEDEVRMRTYERLAHGTSYAVMIPGRRSRQGLTISQVSRNLSRFVLTLEEGFAKYGSADPNILIGGSVACVLPTRRLSYEVRLPARARIREAFVACKPIGVLPVHLGAHWIERLHGGRHRADFDAARGSYRVEIERPLCGFDYGIGLYVG